MAKKKQALSSAELLAEALVREEDWPYQVPGNWVWVRLGSVAACSKEKFNDFDSADEKRYIGLEHIQKDLGIIGHGSSNDIKSQKSVFYDGDILYGKLRPYLNKHDIADFEGICSTDILVLKTKPICINKLLNYYLNTDYFICNAIANSKGINLPRVSETTVLDAIFPLPPLAEQQRIVDRIESLFDQLDQAKELIQAALDSFENRKAAILHQAFTGQLTKKWRAAHGVGMESWEEKTLKDICKISSGGTPSRKVIEYYNGNIPWVKTGEIKWNYLEDSEEKITDEAINNSSAKLFPAGAVLVAMYGQGLTRGRAAILNIDATTNQAVCALIPSEAINNVFLYYYFMCNYWKFREMAFGGNQPNFSGTMIAKFSIMLPELKEQHEIVDILDDLFAKEQNAKDLCDLIDQIEAIKKNILGKAFRGELGTNQAGEARARELLQQVLSQQGQAN